MLSYKMALILRLKITYKNGSTGSTSLYREFVIDCSFVRFMD